MQMELVDVAASIGPGGERLDLLLHRRRSGSTSANLVKALAERVPNAHRMRQIGVRDEAKLPADYGDCGKPVCCNTHLSEMPPVSDEDGQVAESDARLRRRFRGDAAG